MNQNRSRAKVDLNKIKSQKSNQNSLKLQSLKTQSRNVGEIRNNSENLRSSLETSKIFERKANDSDPNQQPDTNRMGSATTLYVETVSNKNNDRSNTLEKVTNGTFEEDKYSENPSSLRQPILEENSIAQKCNKSSKKSLLLEESKETLRKHAHVKLKKGKSKGKKVIKRHKNKKNINPHPEFIF